MLEPPSSQRDLRVASGHRAQEVPHLIMGEAEPYRRGAAHIAEQGVSRSLASAILKKRELRGVSAYTC